MKSLFHLFLIAVVLGCPLWCAAGECTACCGEEAVHSGSEPAPHACCEKCQDRQEDEDRDVPAAPPAKQPPVQCFCCGAVRDTVEERPVITVTDLDVCGVSLPVVTVAALSLSDAPSLYGPPRPLSGRETCQLHSLLLC